MLDCTVDMRPCFRMNRNDVCARLRKSFEILVHRRNHEMDVQGLGRMRTKCLHHGRADGNIGDEMTVHDIDMDPIAHGLINGANFLAQAREISGENRSEEHTSELQSLMRTSYADYCLKKNNH